MAGGILLYDHFPSVLWFVVSFAVSLLFFGIAWRRDFELRFRPKPFFGLGLLLFFFGTGAFLTQLKSKNTLFNTSGNITLTGTIGENPVLKNGYHRFIFSTDEVKTANRIYSKPLQIMVYLKESERLTKGKICAGQGLQLSGRYIPVDSVEVRNGFDYGQFLKRKGMSGICFVYPNGFTVKDEISSFRSFCTLLDRWRMYLLGNYQKLGLNRENYAVLASLALGNKTWLLDEQREYYAQSGLAHVLAISGMHIAILYALLCLLFRVNRGGMKKQLTQKTMVILLLWLFAFLSGFSPSAVRATFMFSLFLIGEALGRRTNSYNILFVAATCMLLLNPFYLFDLSFLLSFTALASILYFDPLLKKWIRMENSILLYCRDIVSISTAAQIGVAPLLLRYFGSFPALFLLTNLLALPLLPLLLFLGWTYLPLSSFGIFDPFFHDALTLLLNYMNGVAQTVSSVPYSHFDTGIIPLWAMIALYILLGGIIGFFNFRNTRGLLIIQKSRLATEIKAEFTCRK